MKSLSWFAVCCLSVAYASAADVHVSPDGSDESPATVTQEPIHILLHPGVYILAPMTNG
jgi:hypothetical protein